MIRKGMVFLVALLLLGGAILTAPADEKKKEPDEKALAAALKQATVKGKYQMLLRQIKVPDDAATYGEFKDYGLYDKTSYGGFEDLPKGYWVWVEPFWYIWREQTEDKVQPRAWGPEQVIGQPDTMEAGDIQTAWASQSQDGQDEWLLLEYAEPVLIKEVHIYETYNPGAVSRVTAFKLDGSEVEIWKGQDPTAGMDKGVAELPIKQPIRAARIKVYIESTRVTGWNEIDAVGLKDDKKNMHWAVAVAASSTYAEPVREVDNRDKRIRDLEREVRDLKEKIKDLEKLLDKK